MWVGGYLPEHGQLTKGHPTEWHPLHPLVHTNDHHIPGKGRTSQVLPKSTMESWGFNFVLVMSRFPQLLGVCGYPDDITARRLFQSSPSHPLALIMFSSPLAPCLLNPGRGDVPFQAEHSTVTYSRHSAQLWVSALSIPITRKLSWPRVSWACLWLPFSPFTTNTSTSCIYWAAFIAGLPINSSTSPWI